MVDSAHLTMEFANTEGTAVSLIGPDQGSFTSNFNLFGASNDSNPMSDSGNRFAHSAQRPPDSRLEGSTAYVEDETFTVQLVFQEDGEQSVFQADIPASLASPGNRWSGAMVRISQSVRT